MRLRSRSSALESLLSGRSNGVALIGNNAAREMLSRRNDGLWKSLRGRVCDEWGTASTKVIAIRMVSCGRHCLNNSLSSVGRMLPTARLRMPLTRPMTPYDGPMSTVCGAGGDSSYPRHLLSKLARARSHVCGGRSMGSAEAPMAMAARAAEMMNRQNQTPIAGNFLIGTL